MKKRLLASLLALVMVVGLLPTVALADTSAQTLYVNNASTSATEDGTESNPYKTIAAAITAATAPASTTIKVMGGGEDYEAFVIPEDRDGITIEGENAPVIKTMYEGSPTWNKYKNGIGGCGGIDVYAANVTLRNLTIQSHGFKNGRWYAAPIGTDYETTMDKNGLVIDGCSITYVGQSDGANGAAIVLSGVTVLTIQNSEISGFVQGYASEGGSADRPVNLTVTNNTFDVEKEAVAFTPYASDNTNASVVITGNTLNGADVIVWDYGVTSKGVKALDVVTVENNTGAENVVVKDIHAEETTVSVQGDVIQAYTSIEKAMEYAPVGQEVGVGYSTIEQTITKTGETTYTDSDGKTYDLKAAAIGDTKYDTLAEAFEAAASMTNPVIEILSDVTVDVWEQVWDADGWTINGNDHTITVGTVDGNMNGDYLFYRAGTLNVSDLTVNITTYGNGFDLNDGTLKNVTLTSTAVTDSAHPNYGVFFGDNGTVTLDGCVISGFDIAVYSQPNEADSEDKTSELVIKGSEVSDGMIISYAESTTLTGNTITNASEITLNGMLDPANDPEQVTGTIEENTLANSNLHLSNPDLDNITISQNNITEGSTVQVNEWPGVPEVTGTLDVNNNFWGGEAPTEEQIILPENSTIPVQKDEYLERPAGEPEPEPEEDGQTGPIISILAGDMPFADVRFNDWFFGSVQYVYQAGLMNGTSYTTFDPYAPLTRAMIWTILCRADGNITSGGNPWYAMGRNWAMQNGISDGTNPDGSITREQLITMLFRYADSQGQSTALRADLSSFADAGSVSAYAVDAMAWGVATGLINGRGQNLAPQSGATRAETAAILTRFANAD